MKLTRTQKAILDGLETAQSCLREANKDYWKNIKLPANCAAVPYVRVIGKREEKAAEGLVAAGLIFPIASTTYTYAWKPT